MSNRLDQESEEYLQPRRIASCKEKLEILGFNVYHEDDTKLVFDYKGSPIYLFPYTGWHTGKTIKDGRGFSNLLRQLEKPEAEVTGTTVPEVTVASKVEIRDLATDEQLPMDDKKHSVEIYGEARVDGQPLRGRANLTFDYTYSSKRWWEFWK